MALSLQYTYCNEYNKFSREAQQGKRAGFSPAGSLQPPFGGQKSTRLAAGALVRMEGGDLTPPSPIGWEPPHQRRPSGCSRGPDRPCRPPVPPGEVLGIPPVLPHALLRRLVPVAVGGAELPDLIIVPVLVPGPLENTLPMVRFSISGGHQVHDPSLRQALCALNQVPSGRFSAVPSARFQLHRRRVLVLPPTPVMWRVRCSPWLKKGLSSQKVPMPSPSRVPGCGDAAQALFQTARRARSSRYRSRPASQAVLSGSAVRVSRRWVGRFPPLAP